MWFFRERVLGVDFFPGACSWKSPLLDPPRCWGIAHVVGGGRGAPEQKDEHVPPFLENSGCLDGWVFVECCSSAAARPFGRVCRPSEFWGCGGFDRRRRLKRRTPAKACASSNCSRSIHRICFCAAVLPAIILNTSPPLIISYNRPHPEECCAHPRRSGPRIGRTGGVGWRAADGRHIRRRSGRGVDRAWGVASSNRSAMIGGGVSARARARHSEAAVLPFAGFSIISSEQKRSSLSSDSELRNPVLLSVNGIRSSSRSCGIRFNGNLTTV